MADMKDFTLKKYAVPEVVLLAILVVGLIISHGIVLSRSYIKLSAPNVVPAGGFSFSMPEGAGWQTMPALKFAQNSWYLTGTHNEGDGKSATRLTVSYLLAGGQPDANDWLESRAAQLGQRLDGRRIIKGKDVVMHASMVEMHGQPLNILYGIALLPGGRSVVVELVDTTDDPGWGWNILTQVAESFVFKGNPLLQEGEKVIASLRNKGLGQLLGTSEQKDYFLINSNDRTEGFEVDLYAYAAGEAKMNVRSFNSYFLREVGGRESVIRTSDRLDRFLWISNSLSSAGLRKGTVELRLEDDKTMRVRQEPGSFVQAYTPGSAALPEPFSVALFRQMLADGTKQALIDFIGSEGQIMPGIVELADANGSALRIIKVKYFAGEELSEEIHLDADGRIYEDIVWGPSNYVLKRGDRDAILNQFPQWVDYITNLEKLFKENITEDSKNPRRIVRNVGTII